MSLQRGHVSRVVVVAGGIFLAVHFPQEDPFFRSVIDLPGLTAMAFLITALHAGPHQRAAIPPPPPMAECRERPGNNRPTRSDAADGEVRLDALAAQAAPIRAHRRGSRA